MNLKFWLIINLLLCSIVSNQTQKNENKKRDVLNLNKQENTLFLNLIKTILNNSRLNEKTSNLSNLILKNTNSTIINLPIIQVVIINSAQNQFGPIKQTYTTNSIQTYPSKSEIFNNLSVMACILVRLVKI